MYFVKLAKLYINIHYVSTIMVDRTKFNTKNEVFAKNEVLYIKDFIVLELNILPKSF